MSDLDEQLLRAATAGDLAGVQAALAAGAEIQPNPARPLSEDLRWAAHCGYLRVVQCLLYVGADVHAQRDIALRAAIGMGNTDIVQILLEAGADVRVDEDAAEPEDIPLCQAIARGHLGVVRCMLTAGANPNVCYGNAIRFAVVYGQPKILTALIQAGGSLDWMGPAMQIEAVSGCEADKISVEHLAGQGVCKEALLVLLERQGQTGLVAILKATQILETLDPAGRVELMGDLLAVKPSEHTQASPL